MPFPKKKKRCAQFHVIIMTLDFVNLDIEHSADDREFLRELSTTAVSSNH